MMMATITSRPAMVVEIEIGQRGLCWRALICEFIGDMGGELSFKPRNWRELKLTKINAL